jgi:hypothetical protein
MGFRQEENQGYPERFSVRRVLITHKVIGLKVRDLATRHPIDGLQPQDLDAVFLNGIDDSVSVRREFRVVRYPKISIQKTTGGFLSFPIQNHKGNQCLVRVLGL